MKILAVEFSSPQRSVAVLECPVPDDPSGDGQSPLNADFISESVPLNHPSTASPVLLAEVVEPDEKQTRVFTRIDQVLAEAKLEREAIDCLAVGLGPGSYTGIRVAISVAQGWQLGRGTRVAGVSSVECLAHQAQSEGCTGRIHILLNAQRHEFYLATYELSPAEVRVIDPLRLVSLSEAQARCASGGQSVGPDVQAWFPEAKVLFPGAGILGRLAARHRNFVAGATLEPIYLREARFVKAPPPRLIPEL